jgi:hypothetical protein
MKYLPIIMSHGRPDRVLTYDSLREQGYDGPVCILIDNEDKQAQGYYERFGDMVQVFDKAAWAAKTDVCDNFPHRKAIVYARNACYEVAKKLGYRWFIQFDDDYTNFAYTFDATWRFVDGMRALSKKLDDLFRLTFEFLDKSNLAAVAWAQGGDFIGGGKQSGIWPEIKARRKCMNSWFCDTEKPLRFAGHMNEDCSCYVLGGVQGSVFLQIQFLRLWQIQTQAAAGGMTDTYAENGTYLKSFYTVMQAPSCTKLHALNTTHTRLHHFITYNNCAPKILRESVRKP